VECRPERHRVDHHRVVSDDAKDADLQHPPGGVWANEHRHPLVLVDTTDRVAPGVQHVVIADAVLSGRLPDPHYDNLRCLHGVVNLCCLTKWAAMTGAVWIAHTPADMAREAALVRALPREVGHPEILGVGATEGRGWIVTKEVPGLNLHEAWPTLTPTEQRQAVRQLWARTQTVHDASQSLRTYVASYGVSCRQRSAMPPRGPDAPMSHAGCPAPSDRGSTTSSRATSRLRPRLSFYGVRLGRGYQWTAVAMTTNVTQQISAAVTTPPVPPYAAMAPPPTAPASEIPT